MAARKDTLPVTPQRPRPQRHQRQSRQQAVIPRHRQWCGASAGREEVSLIVGIGASAGGLEALEHFFSHMLPDSGMAFIVMLHQVPHYPSPLPTILGKHTSMCVMEAAEGMRIQSNVIYTAPSDGYLSIQHAMLHRIEGSESEGIHLPINTFFHALAIDQQEKAVGIVLSGAGTDGTLGLKAIKSASGMVMVQEPESAKYDSMPRSAIATGLVDHVLVPSAMPERLQAYAQGQDKQASAATSPSLPPEILDRVLLLIRTHVGHDFSGYKPHTLCQRIARRLNVHHITDPYQYLRFLQEYPQELDLLFKEMLVSVTSFFRDAEVFDYLATIVVPQILATKSSGDTIRIWVAGCATGEEAYSLGIVFQEALEHAGKCCQVRIFATDIDTRAIETARHGVYPEEIANDVSADRLVRFFTKEDTRYRLHKMIRDMVIFAVQNMLSDPPFTKVDLLSCRNLLIYLDTSLRKPLIHLLHYALRPSGFLLLGTSETLHGFDDLFATMDNRCKVFKRNDTVGVSPFLGYLLSPMMSLKSMQQQVDTPRQLEPLTPLTTLIDRHLLEQYVPPSVIINGHGDIVYFHGRTRAYLQPTSDQPQLNVLSMAHEGLRLPLSNAIRQATRQQGAVVLERVRAKSNGSNALVRVVVQQLSNPERLQGLLQVSFEPLSMSWRPRNWKQILESGRAERDEELQRCQDELQRTRAELVASTEEYQSITEKMQSLNEALGSAKEELQSVNEELRTVNTELQHKIDTLSEINDHMVNLLNSDEMTTIFLDSKLHIRGFSPKVREVFRLIPSDIGRPLNDMASTLRYTHLHHDAAEVLRTLVPKMQEVHTDTNTWYRMYIRPYRTTHNEIDGVVITLINITQQKHAEEGWQTAAAAQRYAEDILQTLRVPLLVLDVELSIVSANRWFYQTFHLTPAETEGRYIYEIGCGPWDLADLRQRLVNVLQRDEAFEHIEMVHHFPHLGCRLIRLNACRMQRQQGEADLILLCMDIEDITTRRGEKYSTLATWQAVGQ